mmetsp:Transcript_4417/g.9551  ORF Transcript_4417/g.9551 Transcript_4417/m.9551 type:complete len:87 (-) Transcript_4417:296-556(-)
MCTYIGTQHASSDQFVVLPVYLFFFLANSANANVYSMMLSPLWKKGSNLAPSSHCQSRCQESCKISQNQLMVNVGEFSVPISQFSA